MPVQLIAILFWKAKREPDLFQNWKKLEVIICYPDKCFGILPKTITLQKGIAIMATPCEVFARFGKKSNFVLVTYFG